VTSPGGGRPTPVETTSEPELEVFEFIRFCYRRRRVSWPEIYDDMCAVASRGSFHGWGFADLAQRGVAFTLPELPTLARLVERVVDEERGHDRGAGDGDPRMAPGGPMRLSGAAAP
jgi:hypothetical protein